MLGIYRGSGWIPRFCFVFENCIPNSTQSCKFLHVLANCIQFVIVFDALFAHLWWTSPGKRKRTKSKKGEDAFRFGQFCLWVRLFPQQLIRRRRSTYVLFGSCKVESAQPSFGVPKAFRIFGCSFRHSVQRRFWAQEYPGLLPHSDL